MNGPSLASVGKLTDIHDAAQNPLGTIQVIDGKEYIYLQGVASTVATDFVTYDEAFLTTRLAAGGVGPVAVALAAVVADKFGWYQIGGSAQGNVATAFADNARVYATATAGRVDDAAVLGDQVIGAIGRSAEASNVATIQLSRPFIGVNVGA